MKILTILLISLVTYGAYNFFTKVEKKNSTVSKIKKKKNASLKKYKPMKKHRSSSRNKTTIKKKELYTNEKAIALQIYDKLNDYEDVNPYLEGIRKELNYNIVSMLREIRVNFKNDRTLSVTLLRKIKKLTNDELDTILIFEPEYKEEPETIEYSDPEENDEFINEEEPFDETESPDDYEDEDEGEIEEPPFENEENQFPGDYEEEY